MDEHVKHALALSEHAINTTSNTLEQFQEMTRSLIWTFSVLIITIILAVSLTSLYLVYMMFGYEFTTVNENRNTNDIQVELLQGE
jgi:hypothetical protein